MIASRTERCVPWAVFALLAGVYLLTTGGHTYASDEEQLFRVAESLATQGSFALNAGSAEPPVYSVYGPGQPLVAVPLYLLGWALAGLFPPEGYAYVTRAVVGWLNPLITAASGGLMALAALRLGYRPRAAAGGALLYGLATMAWPHSKTFFAEPLAAGLSFGAFVLALRGPRIARAGGGRQLPAWRLALSGVLAGLACAVKVQAGLALPLLGLWLLAHHAPRWAELGGARRARWVAIACRLLLVAALWGGGVLLGLGLLGGYQWALFGNPLRSGYGGASGVFAGNWAEGLYGLLLSPGKGIVWYAPPLLLLPPALWLLWRRERATALLCAGLALATLLFYGKVIFWHGDGAWGPRYLNMALPFASLPLVALLDGAPNTTVVKLQRRKERKVVVAPNFAALRFILLGATLLAVPVQLGGVLINLNAYLGVQREAGRRYFELAQAPIVGHLRLLAAQTEQGYRLWLAPNTLALAEGFSYSEGDRAAGAQFPRWTLPNAWVAWRVPAERGGVRLELTLGGCLPAALPPAQPALVVQGVELRGPVACPPRRYQLLLAPGASRLELRSAGWRPAEVGIEREGELGVYLLNAQASVAGQPLALAGELVPVSPAPATPVALRQWTSDYRYGHWDLWIWYLTRSGLPAGPVRILATIWAGLGLALLVGGAVGLGRSLSGTMRYHRDQEEHKAV